MAYQFNPEDYGLTKTDKSGHPDDGIISDGLGNYYKIDNFDRQQNEGLDTDQGSVFGSDLEKHARKYTDFDVSNFNTGSDVQKAVQSLAALNNEPAVTAPAKEYSSQSFEEAVQSGNINDDDLAAILFSQNYRKDLMDKIKAQEEKEQFAKDNNLGLFGTSANLNNAFKSGTMSEDARMNDDGEWEMISSSAPVLFDPEAEKLELMNKSSDKALGHIIDKY